MSLRFYASGASQPVGAVAVGVVVVSGTLMGRDSSDNGL